MPLYVRPCGGATAGLGALGDAFQQLRELLPPGLVVVADSAYGHLGPLCAADRRDLLVVPLRADTGISQRLAEVGPGGLHRLHLRVRP